MWHVSNVKTFRWALQGGKYAFYWMTSSASQTESVTPASLVSSGWTAPLQLARTRSFSGGTPRALWDWSCSSCVSCTPGEQLWSCWTLCGQLVARRHMTLCSSVCPPASVTRPPRRSTSWRWPPTSRPWLKTGLRATALRRAAAPTEPWTMRRTASPTPTPSSTSCCSWRRSTSWWLWPTGTGKKQGLSAASAQENRSWPKSNPLDYLNQFFYFSVVKKIPVQQNEFRVLMCRIVCWLCEHRMSAAPTLPTRPWPAAGRPCGSRSRPAGSAWASTSGPWWRRWFWSTETLTESLALSAERHYRKLHRITCFIRTQFCAVGPPHIRSSDSEPNGMLLQTPCPVIFVVPLANPTVNMWWKSECTCFPCRYRMSRTEQNLVDTETLELWDGSRCRTSPQTDTVWSIFTISVV